MRLNLFARNQDPEPESQASERLATTVHAPFGGTFPADEVVWGIVVRNGFDELDDPGHHRGITQHAYLEGNDNVSICGFRPPQSGPRTRRRARLGLPTAGDHPMCGSCARMVVAPRPRVPMPVQVSRPAVPLPVARPTRPRPAAPVPPPVAAAVPTTPTPTVPSAVVMPPLSPWVRERTASPEPDGVISIDLRGRHDTGLLQRGVHTELEA
jgi:hypothetical protein